MIHESWIAGNHADESVTYDERKIGNDGRYCET